MRNGQPHLLVVGAADTGRAPLLAALLRHALGDGVTVTSAGVLAHVGEPADPNVAFTLQQLDLSMGTHAARQLDGEAAHDADLIVAIDQGTARAAARRLDRDVVSINSGNVAEDVQDPHRMPLGIWIASLRVYQSQIEQMLPLLRERLGQPNVTLPQAEPIASEPEPAIATPTTTTPSTTTNAPASHPARAEHIAHVGRLLATVEVLPEIVDWKRLVEETTTRLRSLTELVDAPDDYTLAAVLIVIGLLSQTPRTPPADQIKTLRGLVEYLAAPVGEAELVAMARTVSA